MINRIIIIMELAVACLLTSEPGCDLMVRMELAVSCLLSSEPGSEGMLRMELVVRSFAVASSICGEPQMPTAGGGGRRRLASRRMLILLLSLSLIIRMVKHPHDNNYSIIVKTYKLIN